MKCNERRVTYRWLILIAATFSQVLTFGFSYSVGVLYTDWIRYFDSSANFLSLVSSAPTAVACTLGPVFGFLLDKTNFRFCAFLGGIILTAGTVASAFTETDLQLLISFGIITGFGLGLHQYIGSTIISDYFVDDRQMAEGIIGGGLGLGNFLFSILLQSAATTYTWRGAMLIGGGVAFNLCVLSMFYISARSIQSHPLNFWKKHEEKISTQNFPDPSPKQEENFVQQSSCVVMEATEKFETKKSKSFLTRSWVLLNNPLFLMLLSLDFLAWLAIFIPYVQLVERGRLLGLDENTAAWLSSTIGLSSVIGRPFLGWLADYLKFHPIWSYCINQLVCGMFMVISSFWSTTVGLFTFAAIYGFLSIGYGFIKATAARLLEPQCFADAYGWMLLFEGIAAMVGPYIAGFMYDATQSYNWSFRFGGFLIIISALMCFLKFPIQRWQNKKISKETTSIQVLKKEKVVCVPEQN